MNTINSLIDTDIYKFTTLFAFWAFEPSATGKYKFVCRTPNVKFTMEMFEEICSELAKISLLRLKKEELEFLKKIQPNFNDPFMRFLGHLSLDFNDIDISYNMIDDISITVEGPLTRIMLWEIPILSIVNEVYFSHQCKSFQEYDECYVTGRKRLHEKFDTLKSYFIEHETGPHVVEFGTRRRFSKMWHNSLIDIIVNDIKYPYFDGTSNIGIGMGYGIPVIGSQPHEYQQAEFGFTSMSRALESSISKWNVLYSGENVVYLTDTFGTDYFLKHFPEDIAKWCKGTRQDSGDPVVWATKMIKHYEKLGIDPKTKLMVFSDNLNFDKMLRLHEMFSDYKIVFGIGTYMTNDVGFDPLNIVVKMVECNGIPTIKISDSPSKCICENEDYKRFALEYFRKESQ